MKVLLAGLIVLAAMTSAEAQPVNRYWVFGASAPPDPLSSRAEQQRRRAEAAWLLRVSPELRDERQRDPDPQVVLNLRKTRGNLHLNGN